MRGTDLPAVHSLITTSLVGPRPSFRPLHAELSSTCTTSPSEYNQQNVGPSTAATPHSRTPTFNLPVSSTSHALNRALPRTDLRAQLRRRCRETARFPRPISFPRYPTSLCASPIQLPKTHLDPHPAFYSNRTDVWCAYTLLCIPPFPVVPALHFLLAAQSLS